MTRAARRDGFTAEGVRVGNMLAMVEGADADKVLEALLRDEERA